MDSSSSRLTDEETRQAEIRRQIALLQAQLVDSHQPTEVPPKPPSTPKRKYHDSSVLAPSTPSPKKRKLKHKTEPSRPPRKVLRNSNSAPPQQDHSKVTLSSTLPTKPVPSNLLSKFAALCDAPTQTVKRDDRLALVEDLEPGPYDHKPPFDDPLFERLEPHSGIRLSSRTLSHEDMQEYLRGRYYLSPSRLYSVVRLLSDKQGYDVPIAGDWVTIAVVAERGPVKFTRPPVGIGNEGEDGMSQDGPNSTAQKKGSGKKKAESTTSHGKKYVNVKLIDFGAHARSSSSATGGKDIIRGDAFLTLLLFESDGTDIVRHEDGREEKVHRGGSRGAFESMSKLKEGDVVALLTPKILRPFQRSTDQPHPTSNILALTPESRDSIAVIGKAQDLGMCTVVKRDGKVCGSWCDKRVSDVCEWHVQHAVERRRAGRAEFSMGTSSMSTGSGPKRKPAYDPARQWGLKPAESQQQGTATYIVSGHTINGSNSDGPSMFVAETIGREGQAKAKRKLANKDADRALKALLERDKDGMKAVITARVFAAEDARKPTKPAKGKAKLVTHATYDEQNRKDVIDSKVEVPPPSRPSYSATVIKNLGFDPVVQAGRRSSSDSVVQKKLELLSDVSSSKRDFHLGPRPGRRIRSGVKAPEGIDESETVATVLEADGSQEMVDLDDLT